MYFTDIYDKPLYITFAFLMQIAYAWSNETPDMFHDLILLYEHEGITSYIKHAFMQAAERIVILWLEM